MMTPTVAYDKLLALLGERASQYSQVQVQALVFTEPTDENPAPYFLRFLLLPPTTLVDEFEYVYPAVRLFQKTISVEDFKKTINALFVEKRLTLCGKNYTLDAQRPPYIEDRDLAPSAGGQDSIGWAYKSFWAQLRNGGSIPHPPLIASGLPAFPDAFTAARAFFGIDLVDHSGRQGYMSIIVPNYTARIASLSPRGKSGFRCEVMIAAGAAADLCLKGWHRRGVKDHNFEIMELSGRGVVLKELQKSDAYGIWLVNRRTNEIVDFRSHDRRFGGTSPEPRQDFSEEALRALIKNGENERVEHKEADPKRPAEPFNAIDIAKEIVAFANHEGGMIFLGVRDDCDVIGVDEPGRLRDWVSTVAAQNCKPPINVQFKACTVDGKRIGVVVVPKGTPGVPYQRNDGRTFVRRCASSRPADPHEIQELTQKSESSFGVFGSDY